MSEYKNTVTNLLTALFGEPPVNYQGGSPKRAVNALRKYCDAIFVPAHMFTACHYESVVYLSAQVLPRTDSTNRKQKWQAISGPTVLQSTSRSTLNPAAHVHSSLCHAVRLLALCSRRDPLPSWLHLRGILRSGEYPQSGHGEAVPRSRLLLHAPIAHRWAVRGRASSRRKSQCRPLPFLSLDDGK